MENGKASITPTTSLNTLFWFRKGLRLHDNPTLKECLKGSTSLHCVYFLDPWYACSQTRANSDIHKWRFLLESLLDLDISLRELNSRLFVVRKQPTEALPRLIKKWNINRIGFECDSEPFGKQRDNVIRRLAETKNIEIISKISHTLYNCEEVMKHINGIVPISFRRFQCFVATMQIPDNPVPRLTTQDMYHCRIAPVSRHDERYKIPKLEELGFSEEQNRTSVFKGGESEALKRLEIHLEKRICVLNTKHTERTLLADKSILGPYLRFGCLSPRLLYHRLNEVYITHKGHPPSLTFFGQLLWREYLYTLSTNNTKFDRMTGNPICEQIQWNFDQMQFDLFQNGETGFPLIDAIIAQLRQEGWIHPLARQALACFLTWGTLWISWEEGCKLFEDLMLDVDWTISAGSWAWNSSYHYVCKFANSFCPADFGKQINPSGDYVRKFLPVLKNFPDQYIYQPWEAPKELQKSVGCIIGVDYPERMVDHKEASAANRKKLRLLFAKGHSNHSSNTALSPVSEQSLSSTPTMHPLKDAISRRIMDGTSALRKINKNTQETKGKKRTWSDSIAPFLQLGSESSKNSLNYDPHKPKHLPSIINTPIFFGSTPHYTSGTTNAHPTDVTNRTTAFFNEMRTFRNPQFKITAREEKQWHRNPYDASSLASLKTSSYRNGITSSNQPVKHLISSCSQ